MEALLHRIALRLDADDRQTARSVVLAALKALDAAEPHLQRGMCFTCLMQHGSAAPAERRGACRDACGCHQQEN